MSYDPTAETKLLDKTSNIYGEYWIISDCVHEFNIKSAIFGCLISRCQCKSSQGPTCSFCQSIHYFNQASDKPFSSI